MVNAMDRIGLIVPSSNVVVEDLLQAPAGFPPKDRRFHVARLPVVAVDLGSDSARQFEAAALDQAVRQVCEAGVARIVFAGTAGAWLGLDHDRDWVARTEAATGRPASTTTLQVLAALARIRPDRLALITPFIEEVHARIAATFAAEGFPVAAGRHLGLSLSRDMAEVPPARIAELIGDCAASGCDTVLTFCTNFRGAEAGRSEPAASLPATLLDSVAATFEELPT